MITSVIDHFICKLIIIYIFVSYLFCDARVPDLGMVYKQPFSQNKFYHKSGLLANPSVIHSVIN